MARVRVLFRRIQTMPGPAPCLLRRTLTGGDQRWQLLDGEIAGQAVDELVGTVDRVSFPEITQIYEGTHQVQRIVMARQLLKGLG